MRRNHSQTTMANPSNNQTTVNGETYIVLDVETKKQHMDAILGNENTSVGKSNDHIHEKTHTAKHNQYKRGKELNFDTQKEMIKAF